MLETYYQFQYRVVTNVVVASGEAFLKMCNEIVVTDENGIEEATTTECVDCPDGYISCGEICIPELDGEGNANTCE